MAASISPDSNLFAEYPRTITLGIGSIMGGAAYLASNLASSLDTSITRPPPRPVHVPGSVILCDMHILLI